MLHSRQDMRLIWENFPITGMGHALLPPHSTLPVSTLELNYAKTSHSAYTSRNYREPTETMVLVVEGVIGLEPEFYAQRLRTGRPIEGSSVAGARRRKHGRRSTTTTCIQAQGRLGRVNAKLSTGALAGLRA